MIEDEPKVALVAGNVAQSENGAAASGATVRLNVSARGGAQDHVEGAALREKSIKRCLQIGCGFLLKPHAEPKKLLLVAWQARNAGERLGHDLKPAALLPVHEYLGLGLDQGLGACQRRWLAGA